MIKGSKNMKRIPDVECASICGLFCGACPAFPDECHGCFSDLFANLAKIVPSTVF